MAEQVGAGVSDPAAFLRSILEGSTEYSIVGKDLSGTVVAWNEGARRVYGYEANDVVGKASAFILHDQDDVASGRAQAILDEARRTGKWSGELGRVRKDGTRFTAYVTITLRRDDVGQPIGFTMISRDLTESQRILRELRESQEYNRGLIESNIDALMTTDRLGVISDVNRAGPNGTTPTVVVTVVAERGAALGFAVSEFLVKPVQSEELLGALERVGVLPGAGRTVLVVDDDPNALKLAESVLASGGFRPLCRPDAKEALEIAKEDPPSAVILDLLMPGMDGFEFLRRLRRTKHGRHVPVIVWTVKDLTAEERERLQKTAQAVIAKDEESTSSLLEELHAHVGRQAVG